VALADGAAVNHDEGTVVTSSGHDGAGHVLVTTWDGDVGIVVLGTGDGLNGISDDFSSLKREAHALATHGDCVRHTNGVELPSDHAFLLEGVLDDLTEIKEMGIARVSLPPDSSNTNLRGVLHLLLVLDTSSVEHSLSSGVVMLASDLCRPAVKSSTGRKAREGNVVA
jgi:hypothetical protein